MAGWLDTDTHQQLLLRETVVIGNRWINVVKCAEVKRKNVTKICVRGKM